MKNLILEDIFIREPDVPGVGGKRVFAAKLPPPAGPRLQVVEPTKHCIKLSD